MAAVSERKTVEPRLTGMAPAARMASISAGLKSPSGPTSIPMEAGAGLAARCTSFLARALGAVRLSAKQESAAGLVLDRIFFIADVAEHMVSDLNDLDVGVYFIAHTFGM